MSPFILSHTTAQEALTIIHLNTQLTAPAGEQLTVPSLPLPLPPSLSLSLTLASSLPAHLLQPPPPASLFFHRSPHLLFLCQTKCTHPLILSAHYFILFPPTHSHALLRENKYQSEVLLDVHFHMPPTNLFLFDGPFQKIFSLGIRQSQSWKANNIRWWD